MIDHLKEYTQVLKMSILFQSILHSYDIPDDLIKIRDISADPNQSEIQVLHALKQRAGSVI